MTAEKSVQPDVRSLLRDELVTRFAAWQQPAYRVDQLLHWLYSRKASTWDIMSNLPKGLREELATSFTLRTHELVQVQGADDTTRKFLWRLHDGALIESVLIPANPALYGEASDRHTLCISTQVGCAYGCRFCASGLDGWKRNLSASEIVEQVLAVERWHEARTAKISPPPADRPASLETERTSAPEKSAAGPARLINNLVIMGMGEPLANYANLMQALRILNAPWGGGIGARKITISTSGLVPQIRQLAEEPLQFRLAISLHGATDETRDKIMPINRKYPLAQLTAACEDYQRRKDRMITFEYILIDGINDDPSETKPLATLARRLNAKVNLIPYNAVEGLPWKRPSEAAQEVFLSRLERHHITATLRREKGHDIDAACGQLRLRTERAGVVETGAPASPIAVAPPSPAATTRDRSAHRPSDRHSDRPSHRRPEQRQRPVGRPQRPNSETRPTAGARPDRPFGRDFTRGAERDARHSSESRPHRDPRDFERPPRTFKQARPGSTSPRDPARAPRDPKRTPHGSGGPPGGRKPFPPRTGGRRPNQGGPRHRRD